MEPIFLSGENLNMGTRVRTNLKEDERPRHFIREWRKSKGLTQEALASRLDVAVSTISQLETGKQGYSQPMLEALAVALGTEPASLLMRNPLEVDSPWAIQERLAKAPPARRRDILLVVDAMLTGTGG